jgi:hypothetical protein
MRLSTIVVCLLLLAPARSPGCFEYTSEATPELSTPHRGYIEAGAGGASGERVRMAGAGAAAVALVVVIARGFRRAGGRPTDAVLPSRLRLDRAEIGLGSGHSRPTAGGVPTPGATG